MAVLMSLRIGLMTSGRCNASPMSCAAQCRMCPTSTQSGARWPRSSLWPRQGQQRATLRDRRQGKSAQVLGDNPPRLTAVLTIQHADVLERHAGQPFRQLEVHHHLPIGVTQQIDVNITRQSQGRARRRMDLFKDPQLVIAIKARGAVYARSK